MSKSANPMVPLKEVMEPVFRLERPLHGTIYRQLGVRLWGEGAYQRSPMDGGETKYPFLNRVEENDVVVNKIWARNGSVAVVPEIFKGCYVSGEFPLFKIDKSKLEPQWFHWYTKTKTLWNQCDEKARGTSGKNRIRPEQFLDIPMPLPPLPTQRRLAEWLGKFANRMHEIDAISSDILVSLDSLISASSRKAFADLSGAEILPIESFSDVRGGIQKSHIREPGANPRRYITVAHVQTNRILLSDPRYFEVSDEELKLWRLQAGDVLSIEGNGSADQVGRTAVFSGEIEDCVHQNHVIRIRPDCNRMAPEFLNAFMNSPRGRSEILARGRTTSGLFNLSVGRIKSIPVPVPSLEIQHLLVRYLKNMRSMGEVINSRNDIIQRELAMLRESTIKSAFG